MSAFHEGLLAALPQPLVWLDGQGALRYANPAARALGLAAEPGLGALRQALAAGELALAGGCWSLSVVPHAGGQLVILSDAGECQQLKQELAEARAQLEQTARAQRELLSRMSHELRTPLNAMLGFAQLLALDPLSDEQQRAVARILSAGRHLLGLINEVLELSRMELWGVTLASELVALPPLVDEVVALLAPQLAERRLALHHAREADLPRVYADSGRLRQVLINLLANAIKYNREGGSITVRYACFSHQVLRIAIDDSGIGIAPEKLSRLFVPFDRLDMERSGIEGSGLGLALSQRLVKAMGGELGAASTPGEGSSFWVDLPCEPRPQLHLSAVPAKARVIYLDAQLSELALIEAAAARVGDLELLPLRQASAALAQARERAELVILGRPALVGPLACALHLAALPKPPALLALVAPDEAALAAQLARLGTVLTLPLVLEQLIALLTQLKAGTLKGGWVAPLVVSPYEAAELVQRAQALLAGLGAQPERRQLELLRQSVEQLADLAASSAALEAGNLELLERLARLAEFRDDASGQHPRRIGRWVQRVAQQLGFNEAESRLLGRAAQLHDIGKIAIADAILLKPGPLTAAERRVMRSHSAIGASLLAGDSPLLRYARQIAEGHHERWEGGGYPHGLAGEEIPIAARIAAVADVYDALTHVRPYKAAWSDEVARAYLRSQRGRQFDAEVLDAFMAVLAAAQRGP